MNILFICKHNRFRSKVAESIFNKLNKDNGIETKSAGITRDLMRPYVAENVHKALSEKGYKIENEQAREIDKMIVDWADKVIVVANNVDSEVFNDKNVEVWNIEDCDESEIDKIRGIVVRIETKIRNLIKRIGLNKS